MDPPGNFVVLCESFAVVGVDNEVEGIVEVREEFEFIVVVDDVFAVEPVVVVVVDVVFRHGVVVEFVVVDGIVEVVLIGVVDEVLQVHKDVLFKIDFICA